MPDVKNPYKISYKGFDLDKRNDMIVEHLPLVKYIANRMAGRLPSHIEIDDLVNSGV